MSRRNLILAGLIVVKFALQIVLTNPIYELHRDEFLHLDQGDHLAWGYLSVPPVTSWISCIIKLLGGYVFWVKFFPALFGALTMLVVWKTVEMLKGNLYACVLASVSILLSALLRVNQLYQPNSLDILCWTLLYYFAIRYVIQKQSKWLYAAAAVFAFGFLNKYNIAFLLIGLVPAILLTDQRKIFLNKHLYLAALLAFVLVSPNLFWQYENGFPVFHHMKELSETQLVNVNRMDFVKEQLIFFMGSSWVILAGFYALLFTRRFAEMRFMFFAWVITMLTFVYFRAKGYYGIGLHPIHIAFGAVFVAEMRFFGKHEWIKPLLLVIPVLFFFPMYRVAFPNKSPQEIMDNAQEYKNLGLLRWEDGKDHHLPQDFADMLGWEALAAKVDSVYAQSPDPAETLVLCDNYGQAGAINFYTRQHIRAVSFNADYLHWFDLDTKYKHLIRVKEVGGKNTELEETAPFFEKAFAADSLTNVFARERGTTVFYFEDAKTDIRERLKAEIREREW